MKCIDVKSAKGHKKKLTYIEVPKVFYMCFGCFCSLHVFSWSNKINIVEFVCFSTSKSNFVIFWSLNHYLNKTNEN